MAGKVFISYRREDERPFALRLYERLTESFGKQHLFFDIDSIPPGFDFVKYIDNQIQLSDVVLVVIGRNWLNAADQTGRRRLDSPEDFVRVEIESALKRDKHVIPLLVHGATMPLSKELPKKMQALARRNAFFTPNGGSKEEFGRLVTALESTFEQLQSSRRAADEEARAEEMREAERAERVLRAEREAHETAERKRKEQEDADRSAAERAERLRPQQAGLAGGGEKPQEPDGRGATSELELALLENMRPLEIGDVATLQATKGPGEETQALELALLEGIRRHEIGEVKKDDATGTPPTEARAIELTLLEGMGPFALKGEQVDPDTPQRIPTPAQAKDWSLSKGQNKARPQRARSSSTDPRLLGGVAVFIGAVFALGYYGQYRPVDAIIFGSALTAGGALLWIVVETVFVTLTGRAKKARTAKSGSGDGSAPTDNQGERPPTRKA